MKDWRVFLCECGGNIGEVVDLSRLARELKGKELEILRHPFLCSPEGQDFLVRKSRRAKGVLVAACAPDLHEETFRRLLRAQGLERFRLVPIREEAAWTALSDPTAKALRLIRAGLAALKETRSPPAITLRPRPALLVIGGGAAGITAALKASEAGLTVYLLEREPFLGGKALYLDRLYPRLECASCVFSPRLSALARAERVEIFTRARLVRLSGLPGDFEAEIESQPRYVRLDRCHGCGRCLSVCPVEPPAIGWPVPHPVPKVPVINPFRCLRFKGQSCRKCEKVCPRGAIDFEDTWGRRTLRVGGVIVATGFRPYAAEKIFHYGYGRLPRVITLFDLEKAFSSGEKKPEIFKSPPERVTFVHCAGSRDRRHLPYCSEICCGLAVKASLRLKELYPRAEIYHFYQDLRLKDPEGEGLYHRARAMGIRFLRGRVAEVSEVPWSPEDEGRLLVLAEDTLLRRKMRLAVDLVVLVPGFVPELGAGELASLLGLCPGEAGFFEPRENKVDPAGTVRRGIWLAGACSGPRDLSETVASAEAAALEAVTFLSRPEILVEQSRVEWQETRCGRCYLCVEVCPFKALVPAEEGLRVLPELCSACGLCVSACPSGALFLEAPEAVFFQLRAVLG